MTDKPERPRKILNVRITADLHTAVKVAAYQDESSLQEWIENLLWEALRERENNAKKRK